MDIADAVLYYRSYALSTTILGFLAPMLTALAFLGAAALVERYKPYTKLTVFNVIAVLCLIITPLTSMHGWQLKEGAKEQMSTKIAHDLSAQHGVKVAPQEVAKSIRKPYDWVNTEGTYRGKSGIQLRYHKTDGELTVYQNEKPLDLRR